MGVVEVADADGVAWVIVLGRFVKGLGESGLESSKVRLGGLPTSVSIERPVKLGGGTGGWEEVEIDRLKFSFPETLSASETAGSPDCERETTEDWACADAAPPYAPDQPGVLVYGL